NELFGRVGRTWNLGAHKGAKMRLAWIYLNPNIVEVQPRPRYRKPSFEHAFLRAEQEDAPRNPRTCASYPSPLLSRCDKFEHTGLQLLNPFYINADASKLALASGDSCAVSFAVRDAATETGWPKRLTPCATQD